MKRAPATKGKRPMDCLADTQEIIAIVRVGKHAIAPVIDAKPSGRAQQSVERSDLRHIKTNLYILLSDEEAESDLHDHAVPSKPDQHRSSESVER